MLTVIMLLIMTLQPQVDVKSFPAEPIKPLAANHPGTYIAGGGLLGDIYLWEVYKLFSEALYTIKFCGNENLVSDAIYFTNLQVLHFRSRLEDYLRSGMLIIEL